MIDILQNLKSSTSEYSKSKASPPVPSIYSDDMFDFTHSIEKMKPSKPTLTVDPCSPLLITDLIEKQSSPKVEETAKKIIPLFNCYNGTKFASPVMNSKRRDKREFDEFFTGEHPQENRNEEDINPIDEFGDEF